MSWLAVLAGTREALIKREAVGSEHQAIFANRCTTLAAAPKLKRKSRASRGFERVGTNVDSNSGLKDYELPRNAASLEKPCVAERRYS